MKYSLPSISGDKTAPSPYGEASISRISFFVGSYGVGKSYFFEHDFLDFSGSFLAIVGPMELSVLF